MAITSLATWPPESNSAGSAATSDAAPAVPFAIDADDGGACWRLCAPPGDAEEGGCAAAKCGSPIGGNGDGGGGGGEAWFGGGEGGAGGGGRMRSSVVGTNVVGIAESSNSLPESPS